MARSGRPHGGRPAAADLRPTGIVCPRCRRGEIVPRRRHFGWYYGCSGAPRCGFWLPARPTGRTCAHPRPPTGPCGALMMEGTRRIPERCSDPTCPAHFPHLSGGGTGRGTPPGAR